MHRHVRIGLASTILIGTTHIFCALIFLYRIRRVFFIGVIPLMAQKDISMFFLGMIFALISIFWAHLILIPINFVFLGLLDGVALFPHACSCIVQALPRVTGVLAANTAGSLSKCSDFAVVADELGFFGDD